MGRRSSCTVPGVTLASAPAVECHFSADVLAWDLDTTQCHIAGLFLLATIRSGNSPPSV